MRKKDLALYIVILVLVMLFLWQWLSKGGLVVQLSSFAKENSQLHFLSGIGQLGSTHIHADVKVYISGQPIDFSQHKYQITTSFIHFEDGLGDVIHMHATGLTIGNLLKSVKIDVRNNCIIAEGESYCNENDKTLKFYVNGKPNSEFTDYIMKDLDKILISYGSGSEPEIQKQLNSVTNLAPKYSANK